MYLTRDELIEHCSATHDKTPQQSQFSQSDDPTDNSANQDTAQVDRETSVVENDSSTSGTEVTTAAPETATRKNGIDREMDSKKKKVGMCC